MHSPATQLGTPLKSWSVLGLVIVCVSLSGCHWIPWWPKNDVVHKPRYEVPENPTAEELVRYLNRTPETMHAWRSTDVKIQAKGPGTVPLKIGATLAVESPANFRLIASGPMGNEADLGSNPERFWFWMRRGGSRDVFTIQHEHLPMVQQEFPVPFQPEWLMETLGVIPLAESNVSLEDTGPAGTYHRLVCEQADPRGGKISRVLDVDKATGHILRQQLYDAQNQLMAYAVMKKHKVDPETGITMPHVIELTWPQADTTLVLYIGDIDVNPSHMPSTMWELPTPTNSQVIDIGAQMVQRMQRHRQHEPLPPLNRHVENTEIDGEPRYEPNQSAGGFPSVEQSAEAGPAPFPSSF